MYFDHEWVPLRGLDKAQFVRMVHPVDGRLPVIERQTEIERRALDFYETVELIRVKDPDWDPGNLFVYFLRDGSALSRLNGTSPPLHAVNAKAPVKITEENCIDYLEFFCFFVRGEEGPFLIAQSMADTYVPKKIDAKTRAVLEGTIRPAVYNGTDADGNFMVDAVVLYSNAVFTAQFKILPTGMVEMLDDEPIAADLPVKIDAPVS